MDERPLGDLDSKARTLYFGEMAPVDLVAAGTQSIVVASAVDEEGEDEDEESEGAAAVGASDSESDRSGFLVQVTPKGARLLHASTLKLASEWIAPAGGEVTLASGNPTQLLLGTRGNKAVLLQLGADGALTKAAEVEMPHEIACVSVQPLGNKAELSGAAGTGASEGKMADGDRENEDKGGGTAADSDEGSLQVQLRASLGVVGLWGDITARVLSLPDLKEQGKVDLGGDVQPRSILAVTLGDGIDRVFVGMGDGAVHSFELDRVSGQLSSKKKVGLAH